MFLPCVGGCRLSPLLSQLTKRTVILPQLVGQHQARLCSGDAKADKAKDGVFERLLGMSSNYAGPNTNR